VHTSGQSGTDAGSQKAGTVSPKNNNPVSLETTLATASRSGPVAVVLERRAPRLWNMACVKPEYRHHKLAGAVRQLTLVTD
jgi:hypothetical protein